MTQLAVRFDTLHSAEYDDFLSNFLKKYTSDPTYQYPIWEQLASDTRKLDTSIAWEQLPKWLNNRECIIFFEPYDDRNAFILKSGKRIIQALDECFYFPFYITDRDFSFFIATNDHDVTLTGGKAKDWPIDNDE